MLRNESEVERDSEYRATEIQQQALYGAPKNDKMMHALRLDVHANELIEITKKDAALHRMSAPRRFDPYGDEGPDTANVTFSPRFAVVQGCFVCLTVKCIVHVLCG